MLLTPNEIINKGIESDNTLSDKSYYSLHNWCYRFLARYSFSIRKPTCVGQKLKETSGYEFKNFYKIYNLRNKYEKNIIIMLFIIWMKLQYALK